MSGTGNPLESGFPLAPPDATLCLIQSSDTGRANFAALRSTTRVCRGGTQPHSAATS